MSSNLSHNLKRVVAGVLVLILVADALPAADTEGRRLRRRSNAFL